MIISTLIFIIGLMVVNLLTFNFINEMLDANRFGLQIFEIFYGYGVFDKSYTIDGNFDVNKIEQFILFYHNNKFLEENYKIQPNNVDCVNILQNNNFGTFSCDEILANKCYKNTKECFTYNLNITYNRVYYKSQIDVIFNDQIIDQINKYDFKDSRFPIVFENTSEVITNNITKNTYYYVLESESFNKDENIIKWLDFNIFIETPSYLDLASFFTIMNIITCASLVNFCFNCCGRGRCNCSGIGAQSACISFLGFPIINIIPLVTLIIISLPFVSLHFVFNYLVDLDTFHDRFKILYNGAVMDTNFNANFTTDANKINNMICSDSTKIYKNVHRFPFDNCINFGSDQYCCLDNVKMSDDLLKLSKYIDVYTGQYEKIIEHNNIKPVINFLKVMPFIQIIETFIFIGIFLFVRYCKRAIIIPIQIHDPIPNQMNGPTINDSSEYSIIPIRFTDQEHTFIDPITENIPKKGDNLIYLHNCGHKFIFINDFFVNKKCPMCNTPYK
jgi:hypothetical protein